MKSQSGYCLLVLMFHGRSLSNKINWIQERALMTYNGKSSSFQKLLENKEVLYKKE